MRWLFLSLSLALGAPAGAQFQVPSPPGTVVVETPIGPPIEWPRPVRGGSVPKFLNVSEVFTAENYPYHAKGRRIEGRVHVALAIDPSGRVSHCMILGNESPPELGVGTCLLFRDLARFDPARDRKGRPVAGIYRRQVKWVLQPHEPGPVEERHSRLIYAFASDGAVAGCRSEVSRPEPRDAASGRQCSENALFAQALAVASGRPDWEDWELVFEKRMIAGNDQVWKSIGRGPDQLFIDWTNVTLQIASSGAVTHCVREHGGLGEIIRDLSIECDLLIKEPFLPAADARRTAQIVTIVYAQRKAGGATTS